MKMLMEDWLRGCVYHDGRHGEVTLSSDEVIEVANYIQRTRTSLVDGMIELPPYDRETEPQIRCPKCGRTDYIKNLEKDFGVKDDIFKYKCINCNTYIKDEPTISKMEQVDKDINVRSKDEPQRGLIACPIQEETAEYYKWLYGDEPQTDCAWK